MRVRPPRGITYGCSLSHLRLQPLPVRLQPQPPTAAASAPYGCSLRDIRLQPHFPTVAAPAAYGCRYAGYSPDEWLAEVSGVPFGLPGQILGTNTDQAQGLTLILALTLTPTRRRG